MALLSKTIIATAAFAFVSSQALSQACWGFGSGMAYLYRGSGNMITAPLEEGKRKLVMKHATKVSKNTVFFMKDGELYSASGMADAFSDLHLE